MVPANLAAWIVTAHGSVLDDFRPARVNVIESSDLTPDGGAHVSTLVRGYVSDGTSLQPLDDVPEPVTPYICFRYSAEDRFAVVEQSWASRYGSGHVLRFDDAGQIVEQEMVWIS